jgi:FkbM family methyltransferase
LVRRTAYAALDAALLGRGVPRTVNGGRVRFPAEWSRYYPRVYEATMHGFLRGQCAPGTTVIDGGAHIGLFTVAMARAVGPDGWVLAFEPTPGTRAVLTRTVALNDLGATVCVRPEGLTDVTGRNTFHIGGTEGSNSNSLVGWSAGNAAGRATGTSREVPTLALDDLLPTLAAPVSCIKLDVEGAELDALTGAKAMLERFHPALCIGVHPRMLQAGGHEPAEVRDLLLDLGYRLYEGPRDCPPERFEQDDLFDFQAVWA